MRKTLGNHAREAGHHGTEECRHTVKQPCRHGGKSFDLEEVHDAFRIPNQGAFGGFERAREASITSLPAASAKPPKRTAQSLKRSEEHTSELQSLMRISYAVFCLKKKKTKNITHKQTH